MKPLLLLLAFAACNIKPAPVTPDPPAPMTPGEAAAATFRVNASDGSMGTGWMAKDGLLVSADHVCDAAEDQSFTITTREGLEFVATIAARHPDYDLCALRVPAFLGSPLRLSWRDPAYDEAVMYVGAPSGVYGCDGGWVPEACGMAPIARGYYAGGNLISIPATGGASGSAIFTADGVVGVLVAGYRVFDSLTFMEPRAHLVEFLDSI